MLKVYTFLNTKNGKVIDEFGENIENAKKRAFMNTGYKPEWLVQCKRKKKSIFKKTLKLVFAFAALVTILISVTTFSDAHNNTSTTINVADIVDWNTDGKELALSLEDGNEVYAYKSESVYSPERQQYIVVGDIMDVDETETGFIIYTSDGQGFYFDK